MKIAIFLDVDKTITRNNIQCDYSKALGCDTEYQGIEQQFQNGEITSARFGERLIELFASKNFTRKTAASFFDRVALDPDANETLGLPVDVYLVSSGPSYYIDKLAEKYRIPQSNVLRSEYFFDEENGVVQRCAAVDNARKHNFVAEKRKGYDVTIGVGDSPRYDTFISLCTVPFLTTHTDDHFFTPRLATVNLLVNALRTVDLKNSGEAVDIETLSPLVLLRRLSIGSWVLICGAIAVIFSAGAYLRGLL